MSLATSATAAPDAASPASAAAPIKTRTLEFASGRDLHALFAHDARLLKEMERALNLKVTTRDGWIRLEGAPAAVEAGEEVFRELSRARERGLNVGTHEFRFAVQAHTPGASPETVEELAAARIPISPRRPAVVPRTRGQLAYLREIERLDLVFGVGPAGTGKTYLATACAVAALKNASVNRIILTRPAVEAGEALGFLPGNLQEKVFPYLRPLYDALHDMLDAEEIQRQMDRGVIEIAPLAYMRGRTLSRAFVILDEAQNTTTEQMFMFLTRLGEGSKCVVTGDATQIDLPPNKRSGLIEARAALAKAPGIGFCEFGDADVVRHELVRTIIRAYETHRASGSPQPRSQAPQAPAR